ncbi:Gfo/Idh/MocA family protein [Kitasatospora sp. NPDC057904]|uniref:Gfo/Idh/MocA family protein n=1 Tax=Kitasatospora sp. NPDC057904 TaxID=3346275 RepID=UPI0036DD6BF6
MINVLLIGVGLHARRAHLPALVGLRAHRPVAVRAVVDLAERSAGITAHLDDLGLTDVEVIAFDKALGSAAPSLDRRELALLDDVVGRLSIDAVVVSTEPLAHRGYVEWALRRGLSVLIDKPVTARAGMVSSAEAARGTLTDFDGLNALHRASGRPDQIAGVVAHRRYHPGFRRVRELIAEVFEATGCPVTTVNAEYGDGEWRMPWEVYEQEYHPFSLGYGMLAHSGYHAYDTAAWLADTTRLGSPGPDELTITSQFVTPADYLAQLPYPLLERALGALPVGERELERIAAKTPDHHMGEVDAHAMAALRRDGRTLTSINLHTVHCSLSARAWASPGGRNLYTSNGRVKQETYTIKQGPFQSIKVALWQSAPDWDRDYLPLHEIGGDRHCEIHVFRNQNLRKDWKSHEAISLADLETVTDQQLAVGPGKLTITGEFLDAVAGRIPADRLASPLASHRLATAMVAGAYESWATRDSARGPVAIAL